MSALVCAKDWARTPLGPIDSWSPALGTTIDIVLANRFPMLLCWGPDAICIYNDAYVPVLGVKHPAALGAPVRDVWTEIYDVLWPLIESPLRGGPSTWSQDLPLVIRRHDFLEETHWTAAYSPVPDETAPAGIGGVLATVNETTTQVVGHRRNSLLRDLGCVDAKSTDEACSHAAAVFERYPQDVPFARIYLLDHEARTVRLVATTNGEGEGPSVVDLAAASSGWPIAEVVRSEVPLLVEDASRRFATPPRGPWPEPIERALVMPIRSHRTHRLAGVLVAGVSPRLGLDASYRGFLETVANRLAAQVSTADAYHVARRRAEVLVESDERFRALVTATSDVVYCMSPDWTELRYLVGRDFIIDTTNPRRGWLDSYVPLEDQPRVTTFIREAVRSKSVFELEHRVLRVDGSLGWTFSRAIPILDRQGNVLEWFGAARDITLRKQAEEALRLSEERYRTLFQSIDEGFCIFDIVYDDVGTPVDYRFVEVNPAFEKHTGLVNACGRLVRDLVPEQEAHWFRIYGEVAATGTPIRFEARGEGMHRWFDVYAFRIGQPAERRVAAVFTDITERKNAVEALRLSEQRFATFFSRSAVAMSIIRVDNRCYTEVNEKWTELFGYRRDEVVGQSLITVAGHELREVIRTRLLSEGAIRDLEVVLTKRSGEKCIALVSSEIVEAAGDQVVLTSFLDITDRKRAEQALVEADRRKDEFLAVLSHELRNPLAPISNGLYILDHVAADSAQAIHARKIIARQVTQLSNLVNDLLDVTRIVSGKVQLHKERLDLDDIVHRAIEDSRSLFERADVSIEVQRSPTPVFVYGDRTRAAQIVGNLLHNAAKFTQHGGHTRVSVAVEGTDAVIRVVDDGIGMSPAMLARVFEPFAQEQQTIERSKGGLGLGLSLVKGLVELHGGTVSAESAGLGHGTMMSVRLPLDIRATADASAASHDSAAAARRRVLIIEDNADAAETLSEILELGDNQVDVAYDGAAGIEMARALHPDIVLCDLGLPGVDGYHVARAVRADDTLTATFLVALSGYARPEDLARAIDAGFDRHIAKPVSVEKLFELLAEVH